MRRWKTEILVALTILSTFVSGGMIFGATTYTQAIEKWREDYQAGLTSDTGWLTVSGLHWLKEGENQMGAGSGNDIVLPSSAPSSVGVLTLHAGKVTMQINPNIEVTLNGKRVQQAELKADASDSRLVLGDLTLFVHASGERLALRVKDKNSQLRKNFSGLHWYPIDEFYAIAGNYVPYETVKELDSQNVLGDAIKLKITGYVKFLLRGQEYRLDGGPNSSGNSFFIVFRDLTSGKETYPAARFVDVEGVGDGTKNIPVHIDFNKAYNPPCAYNPYTTCPLPLPGNRLRVEIPAGEKLYKHDHGT